MNFDKFLVDTERLLFQIDSTKESNHSLEDPLVLAYIGDSWFSLYIREILIQQGLFKVRVLQNLESKIVSATCQAVAWRCLELEWTEEEKNWFRRGRNASPSRTRSGADYRTSTGYETVLGFLFVSKNTKRLEEMAEKSFQAIISFLKNKGGDFSDESSTD